MPRGKPRDPGADKRGTRNRKTPSRNTAMAPMPDALAPHLPDHPADLPDECVPIWQSVVSDLSCRGNNPSAYRDVDLVMVRVLVDQIHLNQQATANIAKYGPLVKGQNGPMPNPMIRVQKDTAATILRYSDALGLNPAARVRLGLMQLAGQSILASLQSLMEDS